ncbi:MAG: cytochrome c biogenesis protein CcsA [Opitutales bacterium]|nr:cytochrome c biogenesis protein CcsA [Opitutales bacterium]
MTSRYRLPIAFLSLFLCLIFSEDKAETLLQQQLAKYPVFAEGRIMPMDTLARSTLVRLGNKQTYRNAQKQKRPAIEFLALVAFAPDQAAKEKVIRVDHPQLRALLNEGNTPQNYFSFDEIIPHLSDINKAREKTIGDAAYSEALNLLMERLDNYTKLHEALSISYSSFSTLGQELDYLKQLPEELTGRQRLRYAERESPIYIFFTKGHWQSLPSRKLLFLQSGQIDHQLQDWLIIGDSYRGEKNGDALPILTKYTQQDTRLERFQNRLQPAYKGILLYLLSFLSICLWGIKRIRFLKEAAYGFFLGGLLLQSEMLLFLMYQSGGPPITGIYSSSVFIGWAGTITCSFYEGKQKSWVYILCGSVLGIVTLTIAHNLSAIGVNTEPLPAIINSNLWLTLHVITITLGYSGSLIAGLLATVSIFTVGDNDALYRKIIACICFTLCFTTVGTLLGGIWADQAWGRFWGWDPKENGALMIILWNALILHAFRDQLIHRQGLCRLAVTGNIITAWSWFGTNLLGQGLHAYGFTENGSRWLLGYCLLQIAILIASGLKHPSQEDEDDPY